MPIVIQEKFKNTNKKKQSKGGGGMDIGSPKKTTSKKLGGSMYTTKTKPAVKGYKKGGKVGNVGKAMDKLTGKAIRKGGGSISEDKLISIMNKAGKSSGLFKKASGGSLKKNLQKGIKSEGFKKLMKDPSVLKKKPVVKKAGGGKLKAVPEGKKGLSKLPTPVRNKMGFMKKGGMLNKKGKK